MASTPKQQVWGRKAKKSNFLQQILAAEISPKLDQCPLESSGWDAEHDFTAQSLQISTSPQLRIRNTKLGEIYQEESTLSSQADEEEYQEVNFKPEEEEKPRKSTVDVVAIRAKKAKSGRKDRHEGGSDIISGEGHERTILEEEGERIPGTPITIFTRQATRGDLKREDSHDLLRSLSKSMSHSPRSSPPKSEVDPEERIAGEARLFDFYDNKSDKGSERGSVRGQTPPPAEPAVQPTPRVTGAYIETPATTRSSTPPQDRDRVGGIRRSRNSGSSLKESNETLRPSRIPRKPPSKDEKRKDLPVALLSRQLKNSHIRPSASADLQNIMQENQDDDSTLEPGFLGGMLNKVKLQASASEDAQNIAEEVQKEESPPEHEDLNDILETEAESEAELLRIARLIKPILDLEPAERRRSGKRVKESELEKLALDRMDQTLRKTTSSIRDARHGIERLEQQVSSTQKLPHVDKSSDLYITVRFPYPRLWRNRRPTWLGICILSVISWFIIENIMCENFCKGKAVPWHVSDPFWGWATPTKLDQWTGRIASSAFPQTWDLLEQLATGIPSRRMFTGLDPEGLKRYMRMQVRPG